MADELIAGTERGADLPPESDPDDEDPEPAAPQAQPVGS